MVQPRKTLVAPPRLSPNQRRILAALSFGMSQREIADSLHIRRGSVRNEFERICALMGTTNMIHAVANALRLGLIE
jgi:DNA-binding NarL/FixJ family response regulator